MNKILIFLIFLLTNCSESKRVSFNLPEPTAAQSERLRLSGLHKISSKPLNSEEKRALIKALENPNIGLTNEMAKVADSRIDIPLLFLKTVHSLELDTHNQILGDYYRSLIIDATKNLKDEIEDLDATLRNNPQFKNEDKRLAEKHMRETNFFIDDYENKLRTLEHQTSHLRQHDDPRITASQNLLNNAKQQLESIKKFIKEEPSPPATPPVRTPLLIRQRRLQQLTSQLT